MDEITQGITGEASGRCPLIIPTRIPEGIPRKIRGGILRRISKDMNSEIQGGVASRNRKKILKNWKN